MPATCQSKLVSAYLTSELLTFAKVPKVRQLTFAKVPKSQIFTVGFTLV